MITESLKWGEQLFFGSAGQPGTLVDHVDQHAISDLSGIDAYRTIRRVPQRIVDQVREHSLQQTTVSQGDRIADLHRHTLPTGRRRTGGAPADADQRAVNHFVEIDPPQLRLHDAGRQAGRVQEVAHQSGQLID